MQYLEYQPWWMDPCIKKDRKAMSEKCLKGSEEFRAERLPAYRADGGVERERERETERELLGIVQVVPVRSGRDDCCNTLLQ